MSGTSKLTGEPEVLAGYLAAQPGAAEAVRSAPDTVAALAKLREAGDLVGAVHIAAHALPAREGVWWACMCADHTAEGARGEKEAELRKLAEEWVRKPSEQTRRGAMARAEAVGLQTSEAWACVGAFWSGGSMAPESAPNLPPPPNLKGIAISGSVVLASVRGEPARQKARLARFLDSALDIAQGGPGRIAAKDE